MGHVYSCVRPLPSKSSNANHILHTLHASVGLEKSHPSSQSRRSLSSSVLALPWFAFIIRSQWRRKRKAREMMDQKEPSRNRSQSLRQAQVPTSLFWISKRFKSSRLSNWRSICPSSGSQMWVRTGWLSEAQSRSSSRGWWPLSLAFGELGRRGGWGGC